VVVRAVKTVKKESADAADVDVAAKVRVPAEVKVAVRVVEKAVDQEESLWIAKHFNTQVAIALAVNAADIRVKRERDLLVAQDQTVALSRKVGKLPSRKAVKV
jgi:hypothetical protein